MSSGQIDNVTQLIMIEEEIDQIISSNLNKKIAMQLSEIKAKVRECQNQSKNYLVPALDLREQVLNLYASVNPQHIFEDQIFSKAEFDRFLSKAL